MVDFLRHLISVNTIIVQFVYGLAFFVLGLAIALQSRHSSQLDLARCLSWLAAFGFVHAFVEWGDLFIPLQAAYLSPNFITALQQFHLLLLGISFACLFEFGVVLLEPMRHGEWLHIASAGLLASWFFAAFFPLQSWIPDFQTWYNSANALARYFIGLPGGLLSAYALRKHIYQRILPMNVPHIVRSLRTAGISLAVYAVATGLIVPAVHFFPGNWLNVDTFSQALIITPPILRSAIGLAIAIYTIRGLEIFDVESERQIEAIEEEQVRAAERERFARELHDGTIQKVYTAGLLVQSAQKLAGSESPVEGRLATAVAVLEDAIVDLRQNLGELRAPISSVATLEQDLRNLAADPRFSSLAKIEVDLNLASSAELPAEGRSHILAIVQEALANSVRHGKARQIRIHGRQVDRRLMLAIQDNGAGLPQNIREGHGLRNMRDRAALLHGRLEVRALERGTAVILDIPKEVSG